MRISDQGLTLIKAFEGFSAEPYMCPAGKRTVGYGHVITVASPLWVHMSSTLPLTKKQAMDLLRQDVCYAEEVINADVKVALTQNQFDALVSFTYNIGAGAFARSTLLKLLNQSDYDGASAQFMRWIYIGKKESAGLVRRREAERAMFDAG
jgi:lysozyme